MCFQAEGGEESRQDQEGEFRTPEPEPGGGARSERRDRSGAGRDCAHGRRGPTVDTKHCSSL